MALNGIHEMNGVAMHDHASTTPGKAAIPLNIVIIGAGIGGLTAAVRLRRNGHSVAVGLNQLRASPSYWPNFDSFTSNPNLQMRSVQLCILLPTRMVFYGSLILSQKHSVPSRCIMCSNTDRRVRFL